jgi:hypothetical protein
MGYDEEPLDPHGECRHEIAALTADVDNLRHQRDVAVLKADRRQRNETSLRARVAALEGVVEKLSSLAMEAVHQRNKNAYGGNECTPEETHALRNLWNYAQEQARAALDEGGE